MLQFDAQAERFKQFKHMGASRQVAFGQIRNELFDCGDIVRCCIYGDIPTVC